MTFSDILDENKNGDQFDTCTNQAENESEHDLLDDSENEFDDDDDDATIYKRFGEFEVGETGELIGKSTVRGLDTSKRDIEKLK